VELAAQVRPNVGAGGLTMQINKVAHVSIDLVAKRKTMVSHAEAH
jgi:hypothetical protein